MKKLLLSLAAMLCVSGAWAESQTTLISGVTLPGLPAGTYNAGDPVSHNGTNKAVVYDSETNWAVMQASAPGYGSPTAANFTWCNAYNGSDGSYSTTGATWDALAPFVGSTAYTTKDDAHFVNFARRGNVRKTDRTFAYRFTNASAVSVYVKSNGNTTGNGINLAVFQVADDDSQTEVEIVNDYTKTAKALTVEDLNKANTYVAYVYGDNNSNGEFYEIAFCDKAPSTATPSFTTDLSSAYNTDTKTTLPLSVVAADATELKWYEATSATADPANDTELGTGASYNFRKNAAGTYYVYCRAYNENATGEKYANSTVAAVTVTTAALNTETALTNLVLDNGCNTAIVGTAITGYYMQGAAVPGVKSITLSDGAAYAINGTTLTVTAEDGTTTQDYTYTLSAVDPLASIEEQNVTVTTPSWLKMGVWNDGKSSHEIYKAVDQVDNMRITAGKNRAYLFVGPCDAVILTNSSEAENADRSGYYSINGGTPVNITWPKYNNGPVKVVIPCSPTQNNIVEIVNTSTSGSWGFDKVQLLTKSSYALKSVLFSAVAKNSVQLDVEHQATAVEVTSQYADVTGGKMYAFDGHAANDAAMVIYGQFNLNSSGASYVHLELDNALKAGDVIYTENGSNLLLANFYVSKTTSKGSKTYDFPYEVTAGSDLEGATDLYIFKNTGSSFSGIKVVGDKVVKIAASGYTTVTAPFNFTVAGGTPYYAASTGAESVTLTSVDDAETVFAAGTGLMIKGEAGANVTLTGTAVDATFNETNLLVGVTAADQTMAAGANYVLATKNDTDVTAFYLYKGEAAPLVGKAYLNVAGGSASALRIDIEGMEDGMETAISLTPSLSEGEGACYDLYGRKSNGKGLMIQNGKVVLVK